MKIHRRKKYLQALAQAVVQSPASPASPDSPASTPSTTSPTSTPSPQAPSAASAPTIDSASIFPYLNKIWGTGNASHINEIINSVNKGLHILSGGRTNVDTLRKGNFNFNVPMANEPGRALLSFFSLFYNKFLINSKNINAVELKPKEKEGAKRDALDSFNSKFSIINIKDPSFSKESIRNHLNSIDVTTKPTTFNFSKNNKGVI